MNSTNLAENSKTISRAIQNLTLNTLDHAVNPVTIKLKTTAPNNLWPYLLLRKIHSATRLWKHAPYSNILLLSEISSDAYN